MATVKNLDEILSDEMRATLHQKIENYLDKPLVFHTAKLEQGEKGTFYRCVVTEPGKDEQFYLSIGAAQPKEILAWVKENKAFPFQAKIVTKGRARFLVNA